jgi:WD40 repeat protein
MSAMHFGPLVLVLSLAPASAGEPEKPPADRLGDPLPAGATRRLGSVRFRNEAQRFLPFLSPDGRTLATSEEEGVRFWDALTGRERRFVALEEPRWPAFLDFSRDSRRCTARFSSDLYAIDLATGAIWKDEPEKAAASRELSPDGTRVVDWTGRERVQVREARTSRLLFTIEPRGLEVEWAFFSPDGRTVIALFFPPDERLNQVRFPPVGGQRPPPDWSIKREGGRIRTWDARTGKPEISLRETVDSFALFTLSPDGRLLAVWSENELVVWDISTGREHFRTRNKLKQGSRLSSPLTFTRDGRSLFWLNDADDLSRWDVASGKLTHWRPPLREPAWLGAAADGSILLSNFRCVVSLDAKRGEVRPWSTGHTAPVFALAFAPDGKTLAARDQDGNFRLWDVARGEPLSLGADDWVRPVRYFGFTPDGRTLLTLSGNGTVRTWELAPGRPPRPGWVRAFGYDRIALSPDYRSLAWLEPDRPGVVFLGDPEGKARHEIRVHRKNSVWDFRFQAAGRLLVTRDDDGLAVWDVESGKERKRLPWARTEGGAVAFTDDGGRLAVFRKGQLEMLDFPAGRSLWRTEATWDAVGWVMFSADGRTLVLETRGEPAGHVIRALDAATGRELCCTKATVDFLLAGTLFSRGPRGEVLVAVATPERGLWDAALIDAVTGRALAPFGAVRTDEPVDEVLRYPDEREPIRFGLPGRVVSRCRFSADGRSLAVASERVELWDPKTGRPWAALPSDHRDGVAGLAFSPDGRTLASGGRDGTILLWDVSGLKADGPAQLVTFPEQELKTWIDKLDDTAGQEQAALVLAASPSQSMPRLAAILRGTKLPDQARVRRLVADLDSEDFDDREAATRELVKLGKLAERELDRVLAGSPSPEMRRRILALFEEHGCRERLPVDVRRALGAMRALEGIRFGEARDVLEEIARRPEVPWLTEQARAALRRLGTAP